MADDIKISGVGGQNPAGGAQSGSSGAAPGGDLNPVIDLRGMDQKTAATPAGATPATVTSAGQQAGSVTTPVDSRDAPASARRANAIMLGDEDAATQTLTQEKYAIPQLVKEKFPDLVQLIKETESMNEEERDYWFQILPIMTEDQIKKFRDILVNEKAQLSNLDKEYEQELSKLNEKHMIEWKEFESKEKRKTIASAEQASKTQEKSDEEELLKRLSQV